MILTAKKDRMFIRSMGVVLGLLLVLSGCGGEDVGDVDSTEPMRCGGIHWGDSAGQDVYTGCEGNAGSWTCVCESDPAQAFQGDTQSNDGAASCAQAVAQTCSMPLLVVTSCAGSPNEIGTCWNVADASGDVSGSTFECRCEDGVAPSEVDADTCEAARSQSCG